MSLYRTIYNNIVLFILSIVVICILLSIIPDRTLYEYSFIDRFWNVISIIIFFEYGDSLVTSYSVWETAISGAIKSLSLLFGSLFLIISISVVIAYLIAFHSYNKTVKVVTNLLERISSIPILIWATILLFISYVTLSIVPIYNDITGFNKTTYLAIGLPILAITIGDNVLGDAINRLYYTISQFNNNAYVTALRSRGIKIRFHLIRNIIPEIMNVLSTRISYLIGGMIVIEFVFNWQGLGWLTWQSIIRDGEKDYGLIILCSIMILLLIVIINIVKDITYRICHPNLFD